MIPVVTPGEMRAVDAAAPEPLDVLVGRAGGAVARAAVELLGGAAGRRVAVVAGPGNNGADGREAARRLRARGARVEVLDAGAAPAVVRGADLVVDAAYGTGLRDPYDAPDPDGAPVLAVDIPSGVDGLTGVARGRPPRAVATVTFAALKPGLLLGDGPDHAGAVAVADIGLDVGAARLHLVEDADVVAWVPQRARGDHKWRHAVRVVGGSPGMTGAPALAATAALRGGAGYVRCSVPGEAAGGGAGPHAPVEAVGTPLPASGWAPPVLADLDRFGALVLGPGLGRSAATRGEVVAVLAGATVPVVVDGDALAVLGPDAAAVLPGAPAPRVLTPHDGEFALLSGAPPGADRIAEARRLAAATGAVVLLKGPCTVVAAPDGTALAVTSGDARLATAGTGDVLAGLLAAHLAAGAPPLRAAAAAAHLHGRAGSLGPEVGTVASDVAAALPRARELLAGGPGAAAGPA